MVPRAANTAVKKERGKVGGEQASKKRVRKDDGSSKGTTEHADGDDKENVTAHATPVPPSHKKSKVREYHHVSTAEPEHRANDTEAPKKPDAYKKVSESDRWRRVVAAYAQTTLPHRPFRPQRSAAASQSMNVLSPPSAPSAALDTHEPTRTSPPPRTRPRR